jgi:hypothetical protein
MNKFLLTSLSVLTLAACINDVEDVQEPNTDSNYKTVYLPIQFVATGANVTRAGDASQEGTVAGSTESSFTTTNNLELYFYDEKGTDFDFLAKEGLNVVEDKGISLTWTKKDDNTFVSNYVLTLRMDENNIRPTQVVAVLNPHNVHDAEALEDESLDVFRKNVLKNSDHYSEAKDENGNIQEDMFTMTNSVYQDADGTIVYASPIDSDNFIESDTYNSMTDDEHLANAVPIYLERVVAKVTMEYNDQNFTEGADANAGTFTQKTSVSGADDGNYANGGAVTAVAKVMGWTIFNTLDRTYLEKSLDGFSATWTWNSSDLHRSYWSQPVTEYSLERQTLMWNSYRDQKGMLLPENTIWYPFENTLPNDTTDNNNREANTCVLVATQLTDSDGNPLQLSYWNNNYYGSISDLKAALKEGFGDQNVTVDDNVEICFQIDADEPYIVHPYIKGKYEETHELLEDAMLWGDGRCYYYQPISHLSVSGLNGIVRNHWYQLKLNSLSGLGTPIPAYDKNETGVPTVVPADETDPDNPQNPVTSDNIEIDPTRPEYPAGGDWNIKVVINIMPWIRHDNGVVKFYK